MTRKWWGREDAPSEDFDCGYARGKKEMKERCAQVADRFGAPPHYIAAAIRALDASPQRIEDQESVMRAFSASDAACYKWPEDTPEQKALRAAYIEGAATASNDQLDWARGPDLEDIISKAKREACAQVAAEYGLLKRLEYSRGYNIGWEASKVATIERCTQWLKDATVSEDVNIAADAMRRSLKDEP